MTPRRLVSSFGALLVLLAVLIADVHAQRSTNDPDVVFNVRSLIYHRPSCSAARRCTRNCVVTRLSEARKRGGRACKICGGRNIEVLNDTAGVYRYFDCTEAAEFLYASVERSVEEDLPREIDYLRQHAAGTPRDLDLLSAPVGDQHRRCTELSPRGRSHTPARLEH